MVGKLGNIAWPCAFVNSCSFGGQSFIHFFKYIFCVYKNNIYDDTTGNGLKPPNPRVVPRMMRPGCGKIRIEVPGAKKRHPIGSIKQEKTSDRFRSIRKDRAIRCQMSGMLINGQIYGPGPIHTDIPSHTSILYPMRKKGSCMHVLY